MFAKIVMSLVICIILIFMFMWSRENLFLHLRLRKLHCKGSYIYEYVFFQWCLHRFNSGGYSIHNLSSLSQNWTQKGKKYCLIWWIMLILFLAESFYVEYEIKFIITTVLLQQCNTIQHEFILLTSRLSITHLGFTRIFSLINSI